MRTILALLSLILSCDIALTTSAQATQEYQLGPDSKAQPGVPKGEVLKFSFDQSKIFPGAYRDYWVYVPAQYTSDKPACLYVNQDGIQWEAPTVFDNLIHKKEMPVTIGVFVMHGRVRAADTSAAVDRFNRSYEYDGLGDKTYKIGLDGKASVFVADSKRGNGQAFGPDGRFYAVASGEEKIIAYAADGRPNVIADGFRGNDIVVAGNGNIYVTNPGTGAEPSKIWLVKPSGPNGEKSEKRVVDSGLSFANGITLSPDQTLLYVNDSRTHWVYSYQIQPDGLLQFKQRYYWLHAPDTADDSGADGMRVDRDGRLYVATRMGIQVCDQAGKVNCIIPTPNAQVSNLCFGGENFDILFATCRDKVYKRKLKVKGAHAWAAPIKPAPPRL